MSRLESFGVVLIACLLNLPGAAITQPSGLDPRVAGPLSQMHGAAAMRCNAGNPQGCAMMQRFQRVANELTEAQFACNGGNPQACAYFQASAQQVLAGYQQLMQSGMAPPMGGMAGGGTGYSTGQMQMDHMNRLQQQQTQAQQFQDQMARQRALNESQNQRFMEQLRR